MKNSNSMMIPMLMGLVACTSSMNLNDADTTKANAKMKRTLFMDVHNLEPGKVKFEDVAAAHQKDVATQGKYGVQFLKYWVDEAQGKVYCLAESVDSVSIYKTHQEAHGLVPDLIQRVAAGDEAVLNSKGTMFFDKHHLGPGKVTAKDVAHAHIKDLAVQGRHNVNFINYWVDEKDGVVICLAQAPDSAAMVNTHKEAHGLIPDEVHVVRQGQ